MKDSPQAAPPDECYAFGPYRLEVSRRRLLLQGERLAVTPKALDTLIALVRKAGRTIDKDELLREIWPDTFVEEATLAQNIATLRRVLDESPDAPTYIATIPRRGYRFIGPVEIASDATTAPGQTPAAIDRASARTPFQRGYAVVAVLSAAITVAGVGWLAQRARPVERAGVPSARFVITPPSGAVFSSRGGFMSISPDGRYLAFIASRDDGADAIWLRPLDALESRVLTGTDGAAQVFWSPDSTSVAFFAEGKLKRLAVAGGSVEIVCDVPGGSEPLAGTWNAAGDILFSEVRRQLYRVRASGGAAHPLQLSALTPDDIAAWPQFLPDGERFLYVVQSTGRHPAGLYVGSLDGNTRRISDVASSAIPIPGYLLDVEQGMLRALPFDATAARITGPPITLAYRVAFNPGTLRGVFTASGSGVVAFRTVDTSQLTWTARDGRRLGTIGAAGGYLDFSISPDGREVAASVFDPATGNADIGILNADGSGWRRLTADPGFNVQPVWSSDGAQILFASRRGSTWHILKRAAHVPGAVDPALETAGLPNPSGWLADGRILYSVSPDTRVLRFLARSGGDGKLLEDPNGIGTARVSPDGRWLAYESHPLQQVIVIRSLEFPDRRWELSSGEGREPRWRRDGREVYYLAGDRSIMAARISDGPDLSPGPATALFRPDVIGPSGVNGAAYDASPDGQRFLVKTPIARSPIVVVTNWIPN